MNQQIQVIHIDDFHNLKKIRYSKSSEAQNCYQNSFDYHKFRNLLEKLRLARGNQVKLNLLDLDTDKFSVEKIFVVSSQSIVFS